MTVYELIPVIPGGAGPLGRHIHHDECSRGFQAATAAALKTVRHAHNGSVLDQGARSSCTGNAFAQCRNTAPLWKSSDKLLAEDDALRIHARATVIDPFPGAFTYPPPGGQDTGSDGLDVCKAGVEAKLITSYTHAFGLDQALHALVLAPVITGTNWLTGMDTPDANGLVHAKGQVRGGHEYCVVGLDIKAKIVWCLNSWGAGWGKAGFFAMSWADWDKLLKAGGDVTVPVR